MESIALLTDEEEKESDDLDKVKLMTIHAAKGLEFDHVYLTGMEENLFPSSLSIASKQELEEERRLFYVAITRAKESLTLTHCQTRYKFGSLQFCEKSRFIDEIPTRFLKLTEKASSGFGMFAPTMNKKVNLKDNYTPFPKKNTSTPTSSSEINLASIGNIAMPEDIMMGVRVYHQKFGYGNVTGVEGSGADKKAMIAFESVGLKTLLLKYAKLVLPEK